MDDKTVFKGVSGQDLNKPEEEGVLPTPPAEGSQPQSQTTFENEPAQTQAVPAPILPPQEAEPKVEDQPISAGENLEESLSGRGPFTPQNIVKLLIGFFAVLMIVFILFAFVFPNVGGKVNQKVSLSYWGLFEDQQTLAPIILDFEKENPNITVNYIKKDIKDYRQKLTTQISQGTGPDVFKFHNTWYPMFSQILLPLPTDVITKDEFDKAFYPVAKKDLTNNGAIYGIPLEIDTLALFTNTEILKQAGVAVPKNWNDFINAARGLTVKDQDGKIKTAGVGFGTFDNVVHAPDIVSLLFVQDGVNLNDLSSSKPKVSDALNFYTAFAIGNGSVWDATLDQSLLAFTKGNLGMYFGYYRDYLAIKQASPALNFEINPVPQLDFQSQDVASYFAEGVSVKSLHQKEALLFMKFLSARDTQAKIYQEQAKIKTYGGPPGRKDLAITLQNAPIYPFVSQAQNATSSYFAGETFDDGLNTQVSSSLSNAITSILGGSPADSVSDSFISSVLQILNQYSQQ